MNMRLTHTIVLDALAEARACFNMARRLFTRWRTNNARAVSDMLCCAMCVEHAGLGDGMDRTELQVVDERRLQLQLARGRG